MPTILQIISLKCFGVWAMGHPSWCDRLHALYFRPLKLLNRLVLNKMPKENAGFRLLCVGEAMPETMVALSPFVQPDVAVVAIVVVVVVTVVVSETVEDVVEVLVDAGVTVNDALLP